jgi:hypothetical protein
MTAWADAVTKGVAVLDPASWTDDGDAYTVQGVSRPVPTSAPVLGALVPSTLATDAPAQDVLVQGSGFVRGDRVVFGGSTPPTSFHSDTELAVRIRPQRLAGGRPSRLGARLHAGPSDPLDFILDGGRRR